MYKPIPLNSSQKCGVGYWEGFSVKLRRDVTLLGNLEYDHWVLVESDSNIITYCERPFQIDTMKNGRIVKSIPSIWVKYRDNSESLIKVTYTKSNPINKKAVNHEISFEKQWCEKNNIKYSIVNEYDIHANPLLLSNKRLIISIVNNRSIPIETDLQLIINLMKFQRVTITKIINNLMIPKSRVIEGICWLLFKGKINSNIDRTPLGTNLEVWMSE